VAYIGAVCACLLLFVFVYVFVFVEYLPHCCALDAIIFDFESIYLLGK
jgi:hypothetical protein